MVEFVSKGLATCPGMSHLHKSVWRNRCVTTSCDSPAAPYCSIFGVKLKRPERGLGAFGLVAGLDFAGNLVDVLTVAFAVINGKIKERNLFKVCLFLFDK